MISNTYLDQSDPCPRLEDDARENWLESWEEFLPHYGWMAHLKNLVILTQPSHVEDEFALVFIREWLSKIQGDSLDSLERLWVDKHYNSLESEMTGPVVKSLFIQNCDWPGNFVLEEDRFSLLEHLADTNEFDGLEHLPHLKYIRGDCRDLEVLYSFFTHFYA